MLTHLQDSHNNKRVPMDAEGKTRVSDVIKSIWFRIDKHREYQLKDRQTMIDNADFPELAKELIEKILEREVKIKELEEFVECCLVQEDEPRFKK